MPRWGGHGLSWPPDSGIGLSSDERTQGSGVGQFDQSTFRSTFPHPPRRKRRAAGQVMTDSDMGLDVMLEGRQRGTPRKQALFGPGCSNSVSPVSDVAEARTGWPIEDEFPEGARSPVVDLTDVVARLQKEVEDFRSESGYGCSANSVIPPQPSGWAGFTSTTVPMFAGKTSWDQYRQVFEANCQFKWMGWCDGSAAALVSPGRRRPERGPAGAGNPVGVAGGFSECAYRAL